MAARPDLVADLTCARRLGISYKRFTGWTPSEGDEVEWDEIERDWMRALHAYEQSVVCPLCGLDIRFCHDEDAVRREFAGGQVEICFVTEMRETAMRRYTESGEVKNPHSQTTKLIAREI